jgi:hypothetical protein
MKLAFVCPPEKEPVETMTEDEIEEDILFGVFVE